MPKINNQLYDLPGNPWWDENSNLYLLKTMVNPWRVPYFEKIISDTFQDNLSGIQLLDIGCGGGYLTEEYARFGLQTTGIDISAPSIEAAINHADEEGLQIKYQVGSATDLEFGDKSFDVVSCCDVLEHIENWPDAIAEITRVLRPGGVFLFDTINRTVISYLTMIFGLEIFPLTRIFTPQTHVWRMFISPDRLSRELRKHGWTVTKLSGGAIRANPFRLLNSILGYKRGQLSAADLGQRLQLKHSPILFQNYLGIARQRQ